MKFCVVFTSAAPTHLFPPSLIQMAGGETAMLCKSVQSIPGGFLELIQDSHTGQDASTLYVQTQHVQCWLQKTAAQEFGFSL